MAAPTRQRRVLPPEPPSAPKPRPRASKRNRWITWTLRGLIGFLILCILLVGTAYLYLRHQISQIARVDLPSLAPEEEGQVMNVLLVGSDSRENTEGDIADATGKGNAGTSGQRSDTMMVLHIDPHEKKAAILSIPRDLYLPIADTDYSDRVNTAFALGGADQLVRTIQDGLGVQIHHYVEVDFTGFSRIVDTVGGVKVYADAPARDRNTGLDIPEAGCVELDGYQALAYVRSRYYESYEGGRWITDPTSDFGRIKRQQDFIRRMMKKAVSVGITNPITLNRLVGIGVDNVTLDSAMSTRDIVTVARRFRSLDPDRVDMFTLPTTGATRGGAAVQLLNEDEAQPFIDRINGLVVSDEARPGDVQVRVLNGNGGEGSAGKAANALQEAGFGVSGHGDADSFGYSKTVIRYGPTQRAKAELLRSYLAAGATLEEDRTLGSVDVTMVVGSDYSGVLTGPAAAPASPVTTQAPPASVPDPAGADKKPTC